MYFLSDVYLNKFNKLFLIQIYVYINTLLVQLINSYIYLLQRFDAIKFYEILILIILIVIISLILQQPYHYKRTGVKILVMCPELPQIIDVKNLENIPHDDVIQKYFRRYFNIEEYLTHILIRIYFHLLIF